MRIYLVGYMGCGKSTLGRSLSQVLDLAWVDLDDEFESRYKIGIQDFFEKYGEFTFRELEQKLLSEFSLVDDCVISTGGGMPCFGNNMEIMKSTGHTIYLKATPELIISRIEASPRKRPLFQQMKKGDFVQNITGHLNSRKPFYEQAHLTTEADNPDIKSLITSIQEYFKSDL